jgi:SAM-dependent methyltransferase
MNARTICVVKDIRGEVLTGRRVFTSPHSRKFYIKMHARMTIFRAIRRYLGRIKRFLIIQAVCAKAKREDILHFSCNICGRPSKYPIHGLTREGNSCYYCGSTVRLRSVIHALSMELFGESLIIDSFPLREGVIGLGLSDSEIYSTRLKKKLNYTNTFYHREPFLDISSNDAASFGKYDFVLCSDVFEHVAPPISKAFENASQLLKPGGVLIFSVPYSSGETREHFPELSRYSIHKREGQYILENVTVDGRHQNFTGLVFHGGPGTVLEMRLFGEDSLSKHFLEAGFMQPRIHGEEMRRFGIVWNAYIPEDAPYRPLIFGLDAPPWAARVSQN